MPSALRRGRPVRPAEPASSVVEAAIARTEAVNPELNGLAYEAFDARAGQASRDAPAAGFFAACRRSSRTTSTSPGMPTMQGADAWEPRPEARDSDFARVFWRPG